MMMQVLALAGLDRDLKHPHLIVLMEQAVVRGRRDQRLEVERPFRLVDVSKGGVRRCPPPPPVSAPMGPPSAAEGRDTYTRHAVPE